MIRLDRARRYSRARSCGTVKPVADVVDVQTLWTSAFFRWTLAASLWVQEPDVPQAFIIRVLVFLAVVLICGAASAADVKVLISAGFFKVYSDLGPAFEKSTGHKLITTRGPSVGDSPEAIPARLARGEDADVVIMDGVGIDLLDQRP